jgi:hypothetical protein
MSFMSPVTATAPVESELRTRDVLLILCGFALVIALRLPGTWAEGRFLDEEVTVFFAYAWNFGPVDALFRPFAGYWNLAANGSTLLLAEAVKADLISLEKAPYATMLTGLLFQLMPVALLLTGKAHWLPTQKARLMAAALVVMVPSTEEVFLNVMHIQFHMALSVAILLALKPPVTATGKTIYAIPLLLGPLSGPGAIVFLPLFCLRAYVDRDVGRAWQAGVLSFGAAIQLLIFYGASPVRGMPLEPVVLAAGLFVRLIALPLGGTLPTALLSLEVSRSQATNGHLVPVLAVAAVLTFSLLAWWTTRKRDDARWLLAAALLVASISLGLGTVTRADAASRAVLSGLNGVRYNFLPVALLSLAILALSMREAAWHTSLAKRLTVILLLVGAFSYPFKLPIYKEGPSWPAEVAAWRADPYYQLRAWPKALRADLSGQRFACPQKAAAPGDPTHPRYCESGWISGFYFPEPKQQ